MRPNIPPLTSLRFFAAAFVLIFHYPAKLVIFPEGVADFGYEAVTFFYILSGFILTYTHAVDSGLNVSMRAFFISRLSRICPAYYLALAIAAPFFAFALFKDASLLPSAVLVPAMLQSWIPKFALSWNAPAWSLSNEIFFYVLFPTIWMVSKKLTAQIFLVATIMTILAVAVFRYCFPASGINDDWRNFLDYFPFFNLPQFLLGVALGRIFISLDSIDRRIHAAVFAGSTLAIALILAFKSDYRVLSNNVLLCVVFSAMIYGAARTPWKALRWRGTVLLGEASYALYILHFPLWLWWDHVVRVLFKLEIPPIVDFTLYAMLVIVASIATLYLVEKPVRRREILVRLDGP